MFRFRHVHTALAIGALLIIASGLLEAQRPVVVIGGWGNVPGDYTGTRLVNALNGPRLGGSPSSVFLSAHEDPYQDINANAAFEAKKIREFLDGLKRAGAMPGNEFDLLGHSMGGLISRVIVLKHQEALGPYHVANLVTLGTPNHGASFTLTTLDQVNPGAKKDGRSTVASSQMNPASPFLRDLNSRTIPATVRAITIAGDVRVTTPPMPAHREDARTVPCVHLVAQHSNDNVPTPCTHIKSCGHTKTAFGKTVNLHPNDGPEHSSDSKTVPCIHKVKQHASDQVTGPCSHLESKQQPTGSDGFIYVASVSCCRLKRQTSSPTRYTRTFTTRPVRATDG